MSKTKGISAITTMVALGTIIILITGTSMWVENNRVVNNMSDTNNLAIGAAADSILQDALLKLNLNPNSTNYSTIVNGVTVGVCYDADTPVIGTYTIRVVATKNNMYKGIKALAVKDVRSAKFNLSSQEEEIDSSCTIASATVPSAPLNLVWSSSGSGQVTINWSAPSTDGGSPISNYKIYRGLGSGSEVYLASVGNILTFTDTGLADNTTYYYKVSAVNTVGESSLSNEVTAIAGQAPTAGTLTVTPSTASYIPGTVTTLTASFTSSVTISSCEYTLNGGTNWYAATLSGSAPNYTCTQSNITGFADGSSYTLNMRATNGAGTTAATALTRTGDTVAPTVTDNWTNNWTATSPVTVTLTSTDAKSGVAATKYCVDTANSCTPATTGTSVSVTCSAGSTCTQYVRYAAWDNVNNASAIYSETVRQDSQAPTNPSLTATPGSGQIALSWTAATDSGSGLHSTTPYKVVFATGATAPANCSSGTALYSGTATTYTHTGLTNGNTYSYRVCALDALSNISAGTTASDTTLDTTTTLPVIAYGYDTNCNWVKGGDWSYFGYAAGGCGQAYIFPNWVSKLIPKVYGNTCPTGFHSDCKDLSKTLSGSSKTCNGETWQSMGTTGFDAMGHASQCFKD